MVRWRVVELMKLDMRVICERTDLPVQLLRFYRNLNRRLLFLCSQVSPTPPHFGCEPAAERVVTHPDQWCCRHQQRASWLCDESSSVVLRRESRPW